MTIQDELNALTSAHGYTWDTNATCDSILIVGHGFHAEVGCDDGRDYFRYVNDANPLNVDYADILDSIMDLAEAVLIEAYTVA